MCGYSFLPCVKGIEKVVEDICIISAVFFRSSDTIDQGEEETGHSVEVLKKARSSEYVDVEQEREEEEEGG